MAAPDAMQAARAEEALRLSSDMAKAREEELKLQGKGEHVLTFTLAADGNAQVSALRAIVAARAFDGKLLGAENVSDALAGEGVDVAVGEVDGAAGGAAELVLRTISQQQMTSAITYMYTGDAAVDKSNAFELLEAAHKLQLPGLTALASSFLMSADECSPSSVCNVLSNAQQLGAADLAQHCYALIDRETKAAIESVGFEDLPREAVVQLLQRDRLTIDECDLFLAVIRWGQKEKKRLEAAAAAAPAPEPDAAGNDGGEAAGEGGGGAGGGGARPDLATALAGVIESVRFPLISPEKLRDIVQPAVLGPEEGTYLIPEALILEAYQHHALVRIGQVSNVAPHKTRPRKGPAIGAASGGGHGEAGVDPESLKRAIAAASRTHRWLEGLPTQAERISMCGMQLGREDAVVLADWLARRGRAVVELDLRCNSLDRPGMELVLRALPHCPKLAGLALAENPLAMGAADAISGALGAWLGELLLAVPKLEKLGLASCGLEDADVLELAKRLRACNNLKILGLSGNALSRAGVEALFAGIKREQGKPPHPLHTLVLTNAGQLEGGDAAHLRSAAPKGLTIKF